MALYDTLKVYKVAYAMLEDIYRNLGDVPRDSKYTLVADMKKNLLQVLVLIYRANATYDKVPLLDEARTQVMEVRFQLRLLKDMGHISNKRYAGLAEQSETLSKELSGWYKYAVQRRGKKEDL